MPKKLQIQIPKLTEFKPIGVGNKRILPYPVRTADGGTYEDQYFHGIYQLQQAQKAYPIYKLFIPSSVDIGHLFKVEDVEPFRIGTGTVVLRPDEDGYTDPRVVPRLRLRHSMIAEHGKSFTIEKRDEKLKMVVDENELKDYREIDDVKVPGWQYIRDFDEEDRGVPTGFGDKRKEEYHDARAWINPNLSIAPLTRGYFLVDRAEMLYGLELKWGPEDSTWMFPLGSEATDYGKILLYERLSPIYEKLVALDEKFKQLLSDLLSE